MSSNGAALPVPITVLQYRDMSAYQSRDMVAQSEPSSGTDNEAANDPKGAGILEAELAARIEHERADAAFQAEQKLRHEFEQTLVAARAPIASLISSFEEERSHYYAQVEAEIVQLALAIAAKILHREAQVDPMLLAALVRLAVERMREGSNVTVRVAPGRGESWKQYFASVPSMAHVEVTEDAQLSEHDCLLETELGTANFGLDTQLKEVEQGFFDLLALRPAK
ncbi:MAG: FliH/SctL family protein [Terracidiphilus sp.]